MSCFHVWKKTHGTMWSFRLNESSTPKDHLVGDKNHEHMQDNVSIMFLSWMDIKLNCESNRFLIVFQALSKYLRVNK